MTTWPLLFMHALTGCDTTSRPYGVGKSSVLARCPSLYQQASIFMMQDRCHAEIESAGEEAILVLYNCTTPGAVLDAVRASRFATKVASSSNYISPERLPPTSDSARYHSRRVYLQVQGWLGHTIDATDWGWYTHQTKAGSATLRPYQMNQAAAPTSLLKIIKCNCTGKCERRNCSCKKNGLYCTLACGQCKGNTCSNGCSIDVEDN